MTEDEMVWRYHQLKGCQFEQALGDSEGQGGLACCGLWGLRELDATERLDNNNRPELSHYTSICNSHHAVSPAS